MKRFCMILVVLALVGAACSGGDSALSVAASDANNAGDSDDGGGDSDAGSDDAGQDDTGSDDDGRDDTGSDDDDGGDDNGGGGFGGGDFCARGLEMDDIFDVLSESDIPTSEALRQANDSANALFDELVSAAPGEIRADVETSIEGFRGLFRALEDADFNILDVDVAAFNAIDTPEYEAATDNVEDYLVSVCGLDPSDDDDDDDLGDVPLPEGGTVGDALVDNLESAGFDRDEAECLGELLGSDISVLADSTNPGAIIEFFEECDIDLARLADLAG